MNTNENCGNCVFNKNWKCHRYPPSMIYEEKYLAVGMPKAKTLVSVFPIVSKNMICGEFVHYGREK